MGTPVFRRYPSGTIDTVLPYKADRYFPHIAAIGDAGTSLGVAVWLPSGSENRFRPAKGSNINMSRHALMPQVGSWTSLEVRSQLATPFPCYAGTSLYQVFKFSYFEGLSTHYNISKFIDSTQVRHIVRTLSDIIL